mgnify:CR=1 FL=1
MVLRLAREKARAGAPANPAIVIAADTAVVLGDEIFGKPAGEAGSGRCGLRWS